MAWWKDADKRKIPSPAEVKAMMGFGPEPTDTPELNRLVDALTAETPCVGIAHDCHCRDCTVLAGR